MLFRSKAVGFIQLNDGSCFASLQVVLNADKLDNYKDVVRQNVGCAVAIEGELIATPEAKQPFELHAASVFIEGYQLFQHDGFIAIGQ